MKMTLTNTTGVVNADVAPTKSSLLQTLSIFYYFFVYLWSMLFSIAITLLVIVCPPLWFIFLIIYDYWYWSGIGVQMIQPFERFLRMDICMRKESLKSESRERVVLVLFVLIRLIVDSLFPTLLKCWQDNSFVNCE